MFTCRNAELDIENAINTTLPMICCFYELHWKESAQLYHIILFWKIFFNNHHQIISNVSYSCPFNAVLQCFLHFNHKMLLVNFIFIQPFLIISFQKQPEIILSTAKLWTRTRTGRTHWTNIQWSNIPAWARFKSFW